jgi:hypothetical protein
LKLGSCERFAWAGLKLQSSQMSAFEVARITGTSHQCLDQYKNFNGIFHILFHTKSLKFSVYLTL